MVKWQFAWFYLGDIMFFWWTPDEHIEHIHQVLTLLNDARVTRDLKKCEFTTNRIDYLGHAIHPGRSEVFTQKVD